MHEPKSDGLRSAQGLGQQVQDRWRRGDVSAQSILCSSAPSSEGRPSLSRRTAAGDERQDGFQSKIDGTSYVPLTVVSDHR